jgi:hypothetical protein
MKSGDLRLGYYRMLSGSVWLLMRTGEGPRRGWVTYRNLSDNTIGSIRAWEFAQLAVERINNKAAGGSAA